MRTFLIIENFKFVDLLSFGLKFGSRETGTVKMKIDEPKPSETFNHFFHFFCGGRGVVCF